MEPIRSTRNRAVVEARRLHRARERRSSGRTLIEGSHVLTEAIGDGVRIEAVFALAGDHEQWPRATPVTAAVLEHLAATETPQGPVAVAVIPEWSPLDAAHRLMVLWGVGDPGNVGTAIRSAAAFGWAVGIGPDTADPWSPKVIRAGAGAHFHTDLCRISAPGDLAGHRVAATVVSGGRDPRTLEPGPWTVVIGSESHGLPDTVVAEADVLVTIPMPGRIESLNAGVAASIFAYEMSRGGRDAGHN